MRRIACLLLGLLVLFVGLAEWQLQALRADYQQGHVSGSLSVHVASSYLPLRQRVYRDPSAVMATAFQTARQSGTPDFVAFMRQAGVGLGMLRGVFLDPRAEPHWRNEAAFEALTLLVRMPWDDVLSQEALQLSAYLRNVLSQSDSATPDERLAVEALQDLVAARHGKSVELAVATSIPPEGARDALHVGLHTVRRSLASCLAMPAPPLDAAWTALGRGFGSGGLRREWAVGWDAGLLQTVKASRISADCERLARRVESMVAAANLSIQ